MGTGIRPICQTSSEALWYIERAEKVFFIATEALTQHWIRSINASADSLHDLYAEGKDRGRTYAEMVDRVLDEMRSGKQVCLVAYGHPGVFAWPMHEAVRRARAEGHFARMLPGISAEDCLFADLGVDPGDAGCQSFTASDFLMRHRAFDSHSTLVLWQIGAIGERDYKPQPEIWNREGLTVLTEVLLEHYPAAHEVTVYEAARYSWCDPVVDCVELARLPHANVTVMSTLYVPPAGVAPEDAEMAKRICSRQ